MRFITVLYTTFYASEVLGSITKSGEGACENMRANGQIYDFWANMRNAMINTEGSLDAGALSAKIQGSEIDNELKQKATNVLDIAAKPTINELDAISYVKAKLKAIYMVRSNLADIASYVFLIDKSRETSALIERMERIFNIIPMAFTEELDDAVNFFAEKLKQEDQHRDIRDYTLAADFWRTEWVTQLEKDLVATRSRFNVRVGGSVELMKELDCRFPLSKEVLRALHETAKYIVGHAKSQGELHALVASDLTALSQALGKLHGETLVGMFELPPPNPNSFEAKMKGGFYGKN